MNADTICGMRTDTIANPRQLQERLDLHCICGASLVGTQVEWVAREMRLNFTQHHRGKDGHGPCSAEEAQVKRLALRDATEKS